jgi:hypothetical protein
LFIYLASLILYCYLPCTHDGLFGRHAVGRIRQPRWRGSMCRSSTGSLGCGYIGSHHRSGAVTKDCTLRSDQPPFRRSRSRRGALSLRKAHRYVPVFLQRIKLSKGPAWRQGGWAVMTQIDGRSSAKTKSRWRTLGAAGIRKAHRVSTFPRMMARRLAGEDRASRCGQAEEEAGLH